MVTTTTLNLCPVSIALCFTRGDTLPWTFTIKDAAGNPIDITGFAFLLTVDPSPEPTTSANNLFQLVGLVTNGPAGLVQFQMSATQSNQVPNVYFYDLQMTDTGAAIRTVAAGEFEFKQDVTK